MKHLYTFFFLIGAGMLFGQDQSGFFDLQWNQEEGSLLLTIDQLDQEFLYVNSLTTGVGSNDIGLDRGKLGDSRIVYFEKQGNKLLLIQPNYKYRSSSKNMAEQESIQEAFAFSVLWGFPIIEQAENSFTINITDFLLNDHQGVANTLRQRGQGNYRLNASKSAVYSPNTLSFPDNTEFESILTFEGDPDDSEIYSVAPDPSSVSVRAHYSFVRLPDNNYEPRTFQPYSGYFPLTYYDYSAPVNEPLKKQYIYRHRLKKKNPEAAMSEAVEPIIYYLDPGTPEPVRSALLEGGRWWNQAFEAAGYKNAFQVKILPEGAHPLDVRYNVIQWVHRSTRGWSYGSSVADPRTGEIIKGNVSLGSLRVRQDFLIAQGILSPYVNGDQEEDELYKMALARIRQLSAHEIGHTLGLAHNFASSADGRESLMDYPHPLITIGNQTPDFSDAYDKGLGEWDKRAVLYGYQDTGEENKNELTSILKETREMGLHFISDRDARPAGGLHPTAHLWDNGEDAVEELTRLIELRRYALRNFGEASIPEGTEYSRLENVLVPVYLMHRYQTEAVVKLIGGANYNYAVKGFDKPALEMVPAPRQTNALKAVLQTLDPEFLLIPDHITNILPPPAFGSSRDRETFSGNTGLLFDPLAAAKAAGYSTLRLLLNEQRLSRIIESNEIDFLSYLERIRHSIVSAPVNNERHQLIVFNNDTNMIHLLIQLGLHSDNQLLKEQVNYFLNERINLEKNIKDTNSSLKKAHFMQLWRDIKESREHPGEWEMPAEPVLPPGSPIGCGFTYSGWAD